MVTGISRFTKGEFNQSALDEVWNKGREQYRDPVAPPSAGIIYINSDDIWDEYQVTNTPNGDFGGHDYLPIAANPNVGQINRISMGSCGEKGFSHNSDGFETWHLLTPWFEVEVARTPESGKGCQPDRSVEMSKSSNTCVMVGHSYTYFKYDGIWERQEKAAFMKAQWQPGDVKRGQCVKDNDKIPKDKEDDYKWMGSNGETYYDMNTWGNWWHPWPGGGVNYDGRSLNYYKKKKSGTSTAEGNWKNPDAIAHMFYAKLALIEPESLETPDDRDSSKFLIHVSSDKYIKYNRDGTKDNRLPPDATCKSDPLHCNDWDLGISKYKTVTNDWQLFSMLSPNIELVDTTYVYGPENILPLMTKEYFDFFFADMPIPTTPY